MPAQKHSGDASPTSPSPPSSPPKQQPEEIKDDSPQPDPDLNGEQPDEDDEGEAVGEDSDDSFSSSDDEQKDEYVFVRLSEIRKEVQCPICLGIIRKTRTVMECLHRFCRECIDKSMRLGNNECPACRTHCASRRSLRDDPNYDALIAVMYPDIDKYEEEQELAFHEEEKARNKQIQDSIAQTFRRQTEALGKKRSARISRRTANYRNVRTRRSQRTSENQGSDEEEDANGNYGGKDSSSADERSPEVKPSRHRRWSGARYSQSSAAANSDAGNEENEPEVNEPEVNREVLGASASLLGSPDILAWGKGGLRSSSRHGSGGGKFSRKNRLNKLMECLQYSARADEELDVSFELVAMDSKDIPNLQRPYLSCKPSLSVKQLCQYVAVQTSMQAEELEIWWKKEVKKEFPSEVMSELLITSPVLDMLKDDKIRLDENQTLGEIRSTYSSSQCNLVLAYKRK